MPSPNGPALSTPSPRAARMVGRPEALRARPDLAGVWSAADAVFPVRITRSWWDRMDPSDPADPLAKQVMPDPQELVAAPGDLMDPVGEVASAPVPWVVSKHPDRALLLVTKRCHLYCRYCFRRTHQPGEALDPTDAELDRAIAWLDHAGVQEVILSGGDPLALSDDALETVIGRVRALPSVRWIRVHTRAPVTAPDRVTDRLCGILRDHGPAWVVVHANHPRELSSDVDEALARLVDAGLPVLNQAVLLRGVNDDPATLAALFELLVERRVRPYYLHHPDAVAGNAHLRVGMDEGLALVRAVTARVSGLAVPRYVVDPPDGEGKVDVARWVSDGGRGGG